MQKEELLHLHMLLVHIRKYYEGTTGEEVPTDQYDALHISPVHIHKNKISHKKAILTLGGEVVQHIRSHYDPCTGHHHDVSSERVVTEL
ncbi:MAG: UPF0058 family protein [Methanoculleus sp.]